MHFFTLKGNLLRRF